jgi:hypothetical protein
MALRPEHLWSAFDLIPGEQADIPAGRLSAKTRHARHIKRSSKVSFPCHLQRKQVSLLEE